MFRHNKKLTALLKSIKISAQQSNNSADILDAVKMAKAFEGDIKFQHNPFYLCSGAAIATAVLIWYQPQIISQWELDHNLFLSILAVLAIVPLIFVYTQRKKITSLSDFIFAKDCRFDNHMESISVSDSVISQLPTRFIEFKRGNYSRKFISATHVAAQHSALANEYYLYKFHYVDRRTVTTTSTDANGKVTTSTKTVYDHYDRYGITLDFGFIKQFQISNKRMLRKPRDYNSASIAFSKKFAIGASTELAAAKYLKPKIVLLVMDLAKHFSDLNIEFDTQGHLCLAFRDSDVFSRKRVHGLAQPNAFYEELQGQTALDKLDILTTFINQLAKYSDNNFEETT